MTSPHDISILTPLFNPPNYLTGCLRSVYSQVEAFSGKETRVRHCLQNGGDLGNVMSVYNRHQELLSTKPSVNYGIQIRSEPDAGMYDALNRAFAATESSLIGHLNADEQYLPGTLARVVNAFEASPEIDVICGAAVVVDGQGRYVCTRPPVIPNRPQLLFSYLTLFTCATFFRRASLVKLGKYYDTNYRYRGDAELIFRILHNKLNIGIIPQPLSLFVDDGNNLALSNEAAQEQKQMQKQYAVSGPCLKPLLTLQNKVKLLKAFQSINRPFDYYWITPKGSSEIIHVSKPTLKWPPRTVRSSDQSTNAIASK